MPVSLALRPAAPHAAARPASFLRDLPGLLSFAGVALLSDAPSIELLVRQARAGQAAASRALYDRHVAAAWGYCRAFARGDDALARDLCQESFATAFARLDQLDEPAAFPGWMRTITRRTCLRWAEGRRREREGIVQLAQQPRISHQRTDIPSAIVREVIAACPDPGLREAARLFYTEPPHSTQRIAEILGISRTAVTSRLHRFRTWARTHMLQRLVDAAEELS